MTPVEVGSNGREDCRNCGNLNCRHSCFLNRARHGSNHQPKDLYADNCFEEVICYAFVLYVFG